MPDTRTEFLFITGQHSDSDYKKVTQYGPEGFRAELPELGRGRRYHACGGYYDREDHFVLLVADGWEGRDDRKSIIINCII